MKTQQTNRIHLLDELRGLAIICMVVHHTLLNIGYLLGIPWGYEAFDFFGFVQPVFWILFIVTSGICTNLSRSSTKRGLLLLGISLVLTFVTAVIMPAVGFEGEDIYFGILHCLACCMILAGVSKKLTDKIPVGVAMAVCLVLFALTYRLQDGLLGIGAFSLRLPPAITQLPFLFPFGIITTTFHSADYFPLFPWVFVFFFGVFMGRRLKQNGFPACTYQSRSRFLQFMGRNSLWVYVVHQPILYVIFLTVKAIFF